MVRIAAALVAGIVTMGGWAVVTVKDLPEYFVAGKQYTIEFQVRQHGRTLLNGLHPSLLVGTSHDGETTVPAAATSEGTYAATFIAPADGPVFLTIRSGFMSTEVRLYPTVVVAAGGSSPAMQTRERGQALFVAKGCNTCHANSDLVNRPDNYSLAVGPALGGRQLATEYVLQKVKHPNSQIMPDLGVSDADAAAIAAFVSASPQRSADRVSH
jgi:mono/diheme cytochrome c family protein